jgi:catechol 2,3-dioxygenase-like lactoylglutathione lyase family enzyme
MKINRLAFIAFPVSDLERTSRFYRETMGAEMLQRGDGYIDFDLGGATIRTYLHEGDYRRQHSGLQFFVDDVESVHSELATAGANLRSRVRIEPWGGRVLTVADPDGNTFDLLDASYVASAVS